MVVPVLMMSCQVSEKWKMGPVTAQIIMMEKAIKKAVGLPVILVTLVEKESKKRLKPFLCLLRIRLVL